ncbi:MAG: hypothetical protein LBF36_02060 [Mycoplasmataceae bacterium]|jgi:hypothetical protein|nr:hypothetical protein [Mycoplasmataceae bacterium]
MTTNNKKGCAIEGYLKSIRDELFILNKTLLRYTNFKMQMAKKCMEMRDKCSKKK